MGNSTKGSLYTNIIIHQSYTFNQISPLGTRGVLAPMEITFNEFRNRKKKKKKELSEEADMKNDEMTDNVAFTNKQI